LLSASFLDHNRSDFIKKKYIFNCCGCNKCEKKVLETKPPPPFQIPKRSVAIDKSTPAVDSLTGP
jgi:hypothetical protein